MSSEEKGGGNGLYYSIIDGSFRVQVRQDHPDAVRRDWKTADGASGTKYERIVRAVTGRIEAIIFKDGEYGKNINITLDKNDEGKTPILSIGTASRYGEDLLKKIPNIDLSKEVNFRPYAFTPDGEDREVKGIEVLQKDGEGKFTVKVKSAFSNPETKQYLLGYPAPDKDAETWDSDEWKGYFAKARKFVVGYIEENVIPKLGRAALSPTTATEYPDEEINPADIPF